METGSDDGRHTGSMAAVARASKAGKSTHCWPSPQMATETAQTGKHYWQIVVWRVIPPPIAHCHYSQIKPYILPVETWNISTSTACPSSSPCTRLHTASSQHSWTSRCQIRRNRKGLFFQEKYDTPSPIPAHVHGWELSRLEGLYLFPATKPLSSTVQIWVCQILSLHALDVNYKKRPGEKIQ